MNQTSSHPAQRGRKWRLCGVVRSRTRKLGALAALLIAVAAIFPGSPLIAGQSAFGLVGPNMTVPPPQYYPLLAPATVLPDGELTPVISVNLNLQMGESRRVFDRVVVASSTTAGHQTNNVVRCLDAETLQQVGDGAYSGRNHEGSDAPYAVTGQLPLYASLLFTAPKTGTFTCQAAVGTDDQISADYSYTVLDQNQSWLQVSAVDEVGSRWLENPSCDSKGEEPTCRYVGGAAGVPSLYVFDNDGTGRPMWRVADNATSVNFSANVELTSCPEGTLSCPDVYEGDSDKAVVVSHLEAIQVTPDGGVCKVAQTSDVTSEISNHAHHYMVKYDLSNVPVSATCGTRRFYVRVLVRSVSGNPVKVDGTRPGLRLSLTNAIATNSTFAAPATVPDVLGKSEEAARSAVTAAGLSVGQVLHVVNGAPAGTVFDQNAVGNTIEPAGSPVNLNISAGPVPSVIGLSQSTATSQLQSVGLVTGAVSTVHNSSAAGTVVDQSPAGGAAASPGTAVNLSVADGKVQVPDIVGDTVATASSILRASRLNLGNEQDIGTADCTIVGRISGQNPSAGSWQAPATAVSFTKWTLKAGTSCQ
jgi:hypothetical protein